MIIWVSERFKPLLARRAIVLKNVMIIWVCGTVGLWDCGTLTRKVGVLHGVAA